LDGIAPYRNEDYGKQFGGMEITSFILDKLYFMCLYKLRCGVSNWGHTDLEFRENTYVEASADL
jgi:hypothetical protein